MPPDRRLSGGSDPAGVLGEWRAPEARWRQTAADRAKLPHDVLRGRRFRRDLQRCSALLLGLFAPAFDEPTELHLPSLRAEGSRRERAKALNLWTARSVGCCTAKGEPRPHVVRHTGTGWRAYTDGARQVTT